jgi:microcystin-dependent protein
MSDPYICEIRMFGGAYTPVQWAACDGTSIAIHDHPAVFSLIGTAYGGDGITTVNLPDMRGRVPVNAGQGPGLTNRQLGMRFGAQTVTLSTNQMPTHTHLIQVSKNPPSTTSPLGAVLAKEYLYEDFPSAIKQQPLVDGSIAPAGGGQAHSNMAPYLAITFIICLQGVYPQQAT